jgi:NAD(P)-dependent dehydrogenase (short-subunit alcohol dehydrogenase family)
LAKTLAAEGTRVSILDIISVEQTLVDIAATGGRAIGVVCDTSSRDSVEAAVAETIAQFGRIDGLINNAALSADLRPKPLEDISCEEFDRVLAVNVRGVFECIRAVSPVMRRQRAGSIINMGSGTFFKGPAGMLPYVTSKSALIGMTRCAARELGADGIRVNCLSPGLTLSDSLMQSGVFSEDAMRAGAQSRCLPRDELPHDLVGVVRFLLSSDSAFMTGQTLAVDGGSVLH